MANYPITTLRSTATFRDDADALCDPDIISCNITKPDGTVEAEELYSTANTFPPIGMTRTSIGLYEVLYDAELPGHYLFTWYGEKDDLKITQVKTIRLTSTDQGL